MISPTHNAYGNRRLKFGKAPKSTPKNLPKPNLTPKPQRVFNFPHQVFKRLYMCKTLLRKDLQVIVFRQISAVDENDKTLYVKYYIINIKILQRLHNKVYACVFT